MKRYLGVDLHRTQFVVCTRWENGEQEIRQWRIGELSKFVEQLRHEDQIAVEATSTTARFYDAVVERVERVVVVNPHQFKVISESVKKTDRNDAAALALYLEKDLLPEVRMKPKQNRELMHLAETRDLLVKLTLGAEGQDQQPAGDAGDRVEAGSLVEQDCAGAGAGTAGQRDGAVGVADSGGADPGTIREHRGVGRAVGRRRPTTARIREPDQHQGDWVAECNGSTDGDWQDQRLRG